MSATPPGGAPAPSQTLGANYRKLFAATVISNIGDGMGAVAYPWLASAVTRNPILIALVAAVQRLPWLLFSLPAGVITDRVDRRRAMVAMDTIRGVVTVAVAFVVLGAQGTLPGPDALDAVVGTNTGLYGLILCATLLLGMAEVLRDNANQTILPSIVEGDRLERANGRIWSAELVANTFIGPPLGSLLLIAAFAIPFFVDASTFVVAAALIATLTGTYTAARKPETEPTSFREELSEGVRWLMRHPLLRPMAIILGLMNGAVMIQGATFVLFAQEVLGVGPFLFTVLGFGAAVGGIAGGYVGPWVAARLGSGTVLAIALIGLALTPFLIGVFAYWPAVLVLFGIEAMLGTLWNVITVSLRQSIIPDHLLGRVNSVYRFFAWGMIPIGAALGGVLVVVVERVANRDLALRSTWFATAVIQLGLFVFGRARLTTDKIEAAREAVEA